MKLLLTIFFKNLIARAKPDIRALKVTQKDEGNKSCSKKCLPVLLLPVREVIF